MTMSFRHYSSNEISQGIISSIGKFSKKRVLEDIDVIVEGEHIKCHSFILASCSDFFLNCLLSNFVEKQDMKVDLPNVTSDTFKLILKSLYTGKDLLTRDNVLDVWAAVHKLQIDFLVRHCESFIVDNVTIETFPAYKKQADVLQCQRFTERVFPFLCQNFMEIKNSLTFLNLDINDVMSLIESDQLNVFPEDQALYSIYDWVSYGNSISPNVQRMRRNVKASNLAAVSNSDHSTAETSSPVSEGESKIKGNAEDAPLISSQNEANERTRYLHPLLKSSRYLLVSENCIETLMRNKFTQDIPEVKNFLSEISSRDVSITLNGFWLKAAFHRACSPYEHVAVVCGHPAEAYSFENNSWNDLTSWGTSSIFKVANLNGRLYGLARKRNQKTHELVYLSKYNWSTLLSLNIEMKYFLLHEKCIYIFSSQNVITKCHIANEAIHSEPHILEIEDFKHSLCNAEQAISFRKNILVFEGIGNYRYARTAVHEWNVANNVWTRVADFDFSVDQMASFNDELHLYILDEFGRLYRLEEAGIAQFSFIEQIWGFRVELKGAILFRKCLYVCGTQYGRGEFVTEVENIYSSLTFLEKPIYGQCFVPFIMLKKHRFGDMDY